MRTSAPECTSTLLPKTPLGPSLAIEFFPQVNQRIGRDTTMLWTILVILLVLWVLGFLVFHVAGGLIHLLLIVAAVILVVRLLQGRRPL
jgi:tetrahydromethanopterin S-methyltransferase subunit G